MDTIAEFLTRIRNAGMARHEKVDIPASNVRLGIAKILEQNGYIRSFKVAKDGRQGIMRVYLKYNEGGKHIITAVNRISRPGCRRYVKSDEIKPVRSGFGISILSTNRGIIDDNEAREKKLGGEILCEIW